MDKLVSANNSVKKSDGLDFSKLKSKDASKVITSLINAKKEYETVREQESTKRMAIQANLKMHIEIVRAKKEIFEEVFRIDFAMRRETIERMFECIDRAFDEDKNDIVIASLNSIEGIIKENPLKSLAAIKSAFEDDEAKLIL